MNLWFLAGLWLLSWLVIIIIYSLANASAKKDNEKCQMFFWKAKDEMIEDGNNLFSTGLVYLIGNILCKYINVPIIRWVILILGVLCCLLPIYSWFKDSLQQAFYERDTYISLMTLTAFINTFVPLIMALNIYFRFLI